MPAARFVLESTPTSATRRSFAAQTPARCAETIARVRRHRSSANRTEAQYCDASVAVIEKMRKAVMQKIQPAKIARHADPYAASNSIPIDDRSTGVASFRNQRTASVFNEH
jgi:hypothetical protein